MRKRFYTMKGWLLTLAAGVIGMGVGCTKYGCPEADYQVKGRVTNQQGTPIPGLQMTFVGYQNDTSYTDADGRYATQSVRSSADNYQVLEVKDIDSTENGSYRDTVVEVSFKDARFRGGDGKWYKGQVSVEHDIVMQEKE